MVLLLATDIVCVSSEINLKQQLVDQLEKAQSSLYTIKIQYEEKVHVLQTQIKNIESERDKVLKEMCECSCSFYKYCTCTFLCIIIIYSLCCVSLSS